MNTYQYRVFLGFLSIFFNLTRPLTDTVCDTKSVIYAIRKFVFVMLSISEVELCSSRQARTNKYMISRENT